MAEDCFAEIVRVAPHSPLDCLYCPNSRTCGSISGPPKISYEIDEAEDWLMHITCISCNCKWSICRRCENIKSILKNKAAIVNHRFRYHKRRKRQAGADGSDVMDEGSTTTTQEPPTPEKEEYETWLKPRYNVLSGQVENDPSSICLETQEISVNFNTDMGENTVNDDTDKDVDTDMVENLVNANKSILPELSENPVNVNNKKVNENHFQSGIKWVQNVPAYDVDFFDKLLENTSIYQLNMKTALYHAYDMKQNGKKYLVANAIGKHTNDLSVVREDEVDFQLRLAKIVMSLTDKQQRLFSTVLSSLLDLYVHKKKGDVSLPVSNVPTTKADLDRCYSRSGTSVAKNLPIPTCYMLKEHSYVCISDCIADFLMCNKSLIVDFDNWNEALQSADEMSAAKLFFGNKRSDSIMTNLAARRTEFEVNLNVPMVPIFLTFWSDDFDPNRGMKSNRRSIWIKTCTIKCMSNDGKVLQSTYPISVSPKENSHDEVEKQVQKELKKLSSGEFLMMYSRFHNSPVLVHSELFCYKMDQPERRKNLKLLGGNSNIHGRFGWLAEIKAKENVVRACDDCAASIANEFENNSNEDRGWRSKECSKCTCWMFNLENNLMSTKEQTDNGPQDVNPRKISLDELTEDLNIAVGKVALDEMHPTRFAEFLKSRGFNGEAIKLFLSIGVRLKLFNQTDGVEQEEETNPFLDLMTEVMNGNPDDPPDTVRPSIWYDFKDLSVYPDIPMHLLFLGIVKTVLVEIGIWLKSRQQHSLFLKMIRGTLEEIKNLNLSWCKLLPYNGEKFGGWVSENFMGFCRLCPWFFSSLKYLPEKEIYTDPLTLPSRWTKKENTGWLQARGLKSTGMTALQMKITVAEYMSQDEVPPIIVNNSCEVDIVLKLIRAMSSLVDCCMSVGGAENKKKELEVKVRYFLTVYDQFHISIAPTKKPGWISSYNFLSLLNLPDIVESYGSMRVLWEGGEDGEGYLKRVKNELSCGLVRQWQTWVMNNLLEDKIFNNIMQSDDEQKRSILREYRLYASKKKIIDELKYSKPISGFVIEEDNKKNIYVAHKKQGKIIAIKLKLRSETETVHNNLVYKTIALTKKNIVIENDMQSSQMGVLLLPLILPSDQETDREPTTYTVITSNWNSLT